MFEEWKCLSSGWGVPDIYHTFLAVWFVEFMWKPHILSFSFWNLHSTHSSFLMSFSNLQVRTPSLNTLLNHNHTPPSSLSIRPHTTTIHRSFTLPSIFRHKSTLPRRTVSSVLQTDDGGTSCLAEPDNLIHDVNIVAIVGEGSVSPLKSASWLDVMLHTAERLKWVDERYEMQVFTDNIPESKCLEMVLKTANILLVVSVTNQGRVEWIERYVQNIPNVICFDSSPALQNKLGGLFIPREEKGVNEVARSISEAWIRHNSDDIRFCLLVVINAYIKPVPILKNLRAQGFSTLSCMVKNCGRQVLNCLLDPNCRKALQCLNQCSPVDQVCSYQCIASYESPILEEFSLCVLQKHNCLDLDAKIPEKPYVPPMVTFRGEVLSHETAEDLFIGWLGELEWSWRVATGQNPAYDQFPCQYQLFYRGKARGSFWYEPVFQVKTLEGELVWRRRKYRVKKGKVAGTFYFSVLDNGVVSNEYWTVVDVAKDFSWGLFHYSGAARVAGQSYTGAVLVTLNGEYPSDMDRLGLALDRCCIKEWELFDVDNYSCKDPPLGLPQGSRLHATINAIIATNAPPNTYTC